MTRYPDKGLRSYKAHEIKHPRGYRVIIKNGIMATTENKKVPGSEGIHQFTMQYGGRELSCRVKKDRDMLKVYIDNNISAELEVHWDGTITQVSGNTLPDSNIEFIKKQVLGQDK
jgi:hypothetical protein